MASMRNGSVADQGATKSCAECRRRRIKCDGSSIPCQQCIHYHVADRCFYPRRRKRKVLSHDEQDANQEVIAMSQSILHQLFGPRDLHSLYALSRENLLASISSDYPNTSTPKTTEPANYTPVAGLEDLATSPQNGHAWNESPQSSTYENVTDDVNGLSLSVSGSTSYVGISSISTALKVINEIDPAFQARVVSSFPNHANATTISEADRVNDADFGDEQAYVDAYFTSIHGLIPMVDETAFRRRFLEASDNSISWQLLLNMVLIMGSVSTPAPPQTHSNMHAKIRPFLTFDCFQYGTIEMVQALTLYGGFYCHFLNKPNVASAVMGSAFKIALAMALHRVPSDDPASGLDAITRASRETQRRTWWCLLCLDTWASPTLGRPTMGWWNTRVMTTALPTLQSKSDYACASLLASIDFCQIASAIQDRFARSPVLPIHEVHQFDEKITRWYASLPPSLTTDTFPHRMQSARTNLLWRAQNMRLILHLPQHYISAVRRKRGEVIDSGTLACVAQCHALTHEIIIAGSSTGMQAGNVYTTRAVTWYLLQACIAQLVSLFAEPHHECALQWTQDIETAIAAIDAVSHLNPTIKRTRDVITAIFQASQSAPVTTMPIPAMELANADDMNGEQMMTQNLDGNWAWLVDDLDPTFQEFLNHL